MIKRLLNLLVLPIFLVGTLFPFLSADAYVSVKGYYRSNGTYVAPHVRSEPNGLKYDNYSYKPSQGLYNDSYGTKGSSWDTPSYVTDPDYYTGKNIYDSLHGGSSYTPTPTCPYNASYDSLSSSCKCNYGYVVSGSSCVSGNSYCYNLYSYGSEYDSLANNCKCSYGYRWNDSSTKCVSNDTYCTDKYGYGAQSDYLTDQCKCRTGYTFENSKCVFVTTKPSYSYDTICPLNSSAIGDKCYCDSGYEINTAKDGCVVKITQKVVSQTPTPTPPAKYYIRTIGKINVRESASASAKVLGVTGYNYVFTLLEEEGDWFKIDFDGKQGWVMKKYSKNISR